MNDNDSFKHVSHYPKKTDMEIQWINIILDKVDELINEDFNEY